MQTTWEQLEKDPFTARLIEILKQKYGDPLPEELRKFLLDSDRWSEVIPHQVLQWVEDLERIVDLLVKGTAGPSDAGFFWIRLQDVFVELDKYFSQRAGVYLTSTMETCHKVVLKLKEAFSEDEKLWIHHERTCQAHVIPGYYRKSLSITKDNKPKLDDEFQNMSKDELNSRLTSVIKPYAGKSSALAADLAKRVQPLVHDLSKATKIWRTS
jgi:hypothetical protein